MLESFRSNRSVLAREAASSLRIEPMYTPSGLYLGHFPAFKCNGDWTRSAFTYMVRGLYQKILKKRIPDDYKFDVARVDRFHAARMFREAVQLQPGHIRLGEGVFDCTFLYTEKDKFASYWLLMFHDSILITVVTKPSKIWPRP
jgi:hypothetical protein